MEKLGILEFSEVCYDNIDTFITTSLLHIEENKEFYDDVIFKLYDFYQRSDKDLSVRDLIIPFNIFLYSMFKNNPSTEKNEKELKIIC